MYILSTLEQAPVGSCPHSCLSTPLIALSPLTTSPSKVITLHKEGVHTKVSNLLQTCAHILKSTLFRKENILIITSSGNLSNELFLG